MFAFIFCYYYDLKVIEYLYAYHGNISGDVFLEIMTTGIKFCYIVWHSKPRRHCGPGKQTNKTKQTKTQQTNPHATDIDIIGQSLGICKV